MQRDKWDHWFVFLPPAEIQTHNHPVCSAHAAFLFTNNILEGFHTSYVIPGSQLWIKGESHEFNESKKSMHYPQVVYTVYYV